MSAAGPAARLALACALLLGAPAAAQETLADIRQQLAVLNVEMRGLTRELSTTGGPGSQLAGTTIPARVESLEAQLQSLTARVEEVSARVEAVSRDGATRIEDLRFQLCELTADCDIAALPDPGPLGGAGAAVASATPPLVPAPATAAGGELASGERARFDAARDALAQGDAATAAEGFRQFVQTYPSGPLTGEARLLLGRSLADAGQDREAARAYLAAFTDAPEGPDAAEALVGLGSALGRMGQTSEACLTLAEVEARFPASGAVIRAQSEAEALGCA